jgi:diguanylate cyclase (GGDEF)-like protein
VRQQTQSDRLHLAVEAGAEITRALAADDAPTVIARHVAEALDVWECSLYEYDPTCRTLTAAAVWSQDPTPEDEAWVGARLSLDERPGYAAIIDGEEAVISRAGDPSMDSVDGAVMQEWGERESLSVPLRFRDLGVVGCLVLIEKREGRSFTEEDIELVTQLAGPVAVAVRNARLFRLQQEQNRYLSSLLETGRAITTSVTLEDSLARICRTAAGSLETGECVIYEYEPAQDVIIRRAFFSDSDMPPLLDAAGVRPLEASPSDRRLLKEGRVLQQALADAALPSDARSSMERWGEKARLRVPLIVEGEPLGILVLIETRRERVFDVGEVELAQALGEQAATAIRHARLYRRGERQNQRLAALLETSRVLCSSLDVGAVLGEVRREVAGLFDVPGDHISLLLRRGESFVPFVTGRSPAHDDEQPPVELDALLRRAADDLVPAAAGDGTRLVVPFVSDETANGLLDLRCAGLIIGGDELELLQILAGQAAAALANAALYRTLERQAITDGLTGLYNHRYFYERLNQEIARAQRYGLPLSLLMIDIDDFKHFNDRFGHPAGDLVLAEVGRILTTHIRTGVDIASRYGGEEFTIVLPNTARDGAHVVGTRLAEHLAALPGAPPRGEGAVQVGESIRVTVSHAALPGADAETHITVSIGVACFPGAAGGPGELVRNADKALYLAKRLGKNRVEVFGD